ncbi:hypothetical protein ACIQC9_12420 [Brevundimonas sp. NPDC092305]|uniref:hypothetical protein n=1 Tax=Brevundimonas sp. NPDC092305 TaxID=3363957 RepID=UPI0038237C6A
MKLLVTLVLATFSIGTPAFAQLPVSPPRYGSDASWEHSRGGALLIGYASEGSGRWISEFYLMPGLSAGGEPVVFARRALDSWDAQEQIRWADSRTCEGMLSTLRLVDQLEMPVVVMPLDDQARARRRALGHSTPPMPDGPGPMVFWAPSAGPVGVEFRLTTYGGPWPEWAGAMSRVLAPCWTDEVPSRGRD